jgi:predicted Zn finger-like uncharacterized protein
MILTCSKCATRYHVDPAGLGPEGRTVRCAGCGHRWTAKPPADAPKPLDPMPPAPAVARRPSPRRSSPRVVAWLVAGLVVVVAASAVVGRNEVVARFPASAEVYEALGLPVTPRLGLEFEQVTSERLMEGGVSVLVVEGEIVNQSEEPQSVPPIRVILLDDGGRQLQGETFSSKEPSLLAGAKTTFTGRLVNPPERARNFSITFDVDS